MGHSQPLFLYFRLSHTADSKQMFHIKVCRCLHSNCGPLVSEATALPAEPQPLSITKILVCQLKNIFPKNANRDFDGIALSIQRFEAELKFRLKNS